MGRGAEERYQSETKTGFGTDEARKRDSLRHKEMEKTERQTQHQGRGRETRRLRQVRDTPMPTER